MSQEIKWKLEVEVTGGPKLSAATSLRVEAYDRIDVVVPAKPPESDSPGKVAVQVQPGAASQVKFLLITSSRYDKELTYKVDEGESIELDALQLLIGSGAVGLLGEDLKQFEFTNAMDSPASIEILVGRNATPTPTP